MGEAALVRDLMERETYGSHRRVRVSLCSRIAHFGKCSLDARSE